MPILKLLVKMFTVVSDDANDDRRCLLHADRPNFLIAVFFFRCQMSDYRSAEASTLMLMSLRKDFMPYGLFLVSTHDPP